MSIKASKLLELTEAFRIEVIRLVKVPENHRVAIDLHIHGLPTNTYRVELDTVELSGRSKAAGEDDPNCCFISTDEPDRAVTIYFHTDLRLPDELNPSPSPQPTLEVIPALDNDDFRQLTIEYGWLND